MCPERRHQALDTPRPEQEHTKVNMYLVSACYKPITGREKKKIHSLAQRLGTGSPRIRCGSQMCCTGVPTCVWHDMCVFVHCHQTLHKWIFISTYNLSTFGKKMRI